MNLAAGAQMVANRLRKNQQRLKSWRIQQGISCYRLYDADLPEYAAAVDVYQPLEQSAPFVHVQEYQAPPSVDAQKAQTRFEELVQAVVAVFDIDASRVACKTRSRGKGGSKYGRMDDRGAGFLVSEGAVRLEVNLFDYLDTGLFLDHRPVRLELAERAGGQRFLNLFCYTASASVHAAVAGARTTSVDLSATYLSWARRNLLHNELNPGEHRLEQADVGRWLAGHREYYDLIFCDPPTFSNSKKAADFDVQRDHVALLRACVARLAPAGRLLFSNNFRRFKLDHAAVETFADVNDISTATLDRDFARNQKIHRCFELQRRITG